MIDLTYDKEKVYRKLCELEEEIPILLKRIEKAKVEVILANDEVCQNLCGNYSAFGFLSSWLCCDKCVRTDLF